MLHQTIKENEVRLNNMESSKFWKVKQIYDKIRFILSSESYIKGKKYKIIGKIRFLLSPTGLKMIIKLFGKVFRGIYLIIYGRRWGSQKNPLYNEWISRNFPTDIDFKEYSLKVNFFKNNPKISFILPVYNPSIQHLTETIESVRNQIYPNWELCIADDCSPNEEIRNIITRYSHQDNRIKYIFREINGHISSCSNSALSLSEGDYAFFS